MYPSCAGGDYWWEVIAQRPGESEGFESCGIWRATVGDPSRIEGTISGSFVYVKGTGPKWTTDLFCWAPDHRFVMVKK